jgi:hypothetical protein
MFSLCFRQTLQRGFAALVSFKPHSANIVNNTQSPADANLKPKAKGAFMEGRVERRPDLPPLDYRDALPQVKGHAGLRPRLRRP